MDIFHTLRHHSSANVRSHVRQKSRQKGLTRYTHAPPHECLWKAFPPALCPLGTCTSPIGWPPRVPGAFERILSSVTHTALHLPERPLRTTHPMSFRDNFRTKRQELKARLRPSPSPDPQAITASSSTNTKKTIIGAIRISLELTEKLSEELPPLQMTVKVLGTVLDMYQVCPTVSKSIVFSNVPECPLVCGL